MFFLFSCCSFFLLPYHSFVTGFLAYFSLARDRPHMSMQHYSTIFYIQAYEYGNDDAIEILENMGVDPVSRILTHTSHTWPSCWFFHQSVLPSAGSGCDLHGGVWRTNLPLHAYERYSRVEWIRSTSSWAWVLSPDYCNWWLSWLQCARDRCSSFSISSYFFFSFPRTVMDTPLLLCTRKMRTMNTMTRRRMTNKFFSIFFQLIESTLYFKVT